MVSNDSKNERKVVVAMSGGVDSSVAACLLKEQGYEVMGLFMRTGVQAPEPPASCSPTAEPTRERRGCCSASDAADARFVAGQLGVPFFALNFEREFDSLIDYFADEYAAGRTPNPCVVCNDRLKFGKIIDYADVVGARYIATGHYARTGEQGGRRTLMRGIDRKKDQSYVLFGIGRNVLDRVMFPIGELEKPEVREIAGRLDLPNRNKPDSVEICFAPDNDYARVVRERRPDAFRPGEVVDTDGKKLGEHDGVGHFTVGQRRGLGIAAGHPIYVTQLNASSNTVTVGESQNLLADHLLASKVSYLLPCGDAPFQADVKIRYLHEPAPATVTPLSDSTVRVDFGEPQRAVTPGQAVVFYDGETVLGGGWIDHS